MVPARTPGRGDFGRWDAMDDPADGQLVVLTALNHPPYEWDAASGRLELVVASNPDEA